MSLQFLYMYVCASRVSSLPFFIAWPSHCHLNKSLNFVVTNQIKMVTEGQQNEQDDIVMDEGDETPEPDLVFEDEQLPLATLCSLNMMRKNRHFCDVVLHVGSTEVHAHRAVLASVSSFLFELFTSDQDNKRTENVITYKLNGGFDKNALQVLVDYAYTGKLEVLYHQVKAVYLAACKLKMDRVVKECAKHLIKNLSVENCVDIRSLPGIARNKKFVQQVDSYIAREFSSLSKNPALLNLFCARIEVLNQSKQEMTLVNHNSLCQLVIEWIKRQITEESLSMNSLSEKTFMLYLAIDNSLQDCCSLPNGDVTDSDLVQDYKKMSLKGNQPNKKGKKKCLGQPSKPRVLIYSRDIGECLETEFEPDWNVIATSKVGEHNFLALVTIAGKLSTMSIQLRLNTPSTPSPVLTPEASRPASEEKPDLYCVLANMTSGRCAVGCANLHGNLLVCGGYDRIECLKTVEQYLPESNTWKAMPSMREARGRFQIAVLGNKVYAVGGSNGTTELDTVEMLDLDKPEKWIKATRLPFAKSNAGVCDLDNKIYCIGGWNGQVGIKQCDVFDPETSIWSTIAPLNIGRYQAGVTSYKNLLYAIGGCDAWNCLNSVEVYDPKENSWDFTKSIITARRGCGVAVFQGKLYAIGGSDGTHSLSSTEVYDSESQCWVPGPSLTTPRANVSVAMVGNRLYAVGGFSGKAFLNTIEYLDANSKEWTTFIPKLHSVDIFVDKHQRLGSEGSGNTSEDNQSDVDDIKDEDKKIIGYNYESNDIKIIDYKDMTKGTTEETLSA